METSKPTVILLHGIFMHGIIMMLLARRLRQCGYHCETFSYHSVRRTPAANAEALFHKARRLDKSPVHFVAHSLGGLVLRHMMFKYSDALPPGRSVTLGTPHNSSAVAHGLLNYRLGGLLGSSVKHGLLGGAPAWPAERELGSLAGTLDAGIGRIVARLPKPCDGTVAVTETRFPGLTDHICLRVTHTGMVFSTAVAEQVDAFLRNGRFRHNNHV